MTELKTMKDFDWVNSYDLEGTSGKELLDDLKAEAVKWIKTMEIDSNNDILIFGENEITINESESWIKFVKLFFNLTDEDLK